MDADAFPELPAGWLAEFLALQLEPLDPDLLSDLEPYEHRAEPKARPAEKSCISVPNECAVECAPALNECGVECAPASKRCREEPVCLPVPKECGASDFGDLVARLRFRRVAGTEAGRELVRAAVARRRHSDAERETLRVLREVDRYRRHRDARAMQGV